MNRIKNTLNGIIDHYIVVSLFLVFLALTLIGVGNVLIVGIFGIVLCMVGMVQKAVRVDLWILVPFIFYNLFSVVASYSAYGNIVLGFASTQMIFPVFYFLMAYLDDKERFCLRLLAIVWAGIVSAIGIGQFVFRAATGSSGRLGGLLGNPNALGIFLVLGWFSLLDCRRHKEKSNAPLLVFLNYLEPVLLIALALTLSMGSFLAMASGILLLLIGRKREASWSKTFQYGCILLAGVSLGIGTGILMFLGADRTDVPWICLLLLVYAVALVYYWETFQRFLAGNIWVSAVISGMGMVVAASVIAIRPNAAATFAERLEMMANGLHYIMFDPFLGVGPYQWRVLNLNDSDKYFNTNHIHNVFIHVGVEIGLFALAMLLVITVRCFLKKRRITQLAGCMAFLCHNLMDTGFFYLGIVLLAMIMAGEPNQKGEVLGTAAVRGLFGAAAALFVYNLYWYLRML